MNVGKGRRHALQNLNRAGQAKHAHVLGNCSADHVQPNAIATGLGCDAQDKKRTVNLPGLLADDLDRSTLNTALTHEPRLDNILRSSMIMFRPV